MASIKVSELTEATDFNTNDYAMIVQSNQNKKITKANMLKTNPNFIVVTINNSQTITSNSQVGFNSITRKNGNFTLSNGGVVVGSDINHIRISGSIFVDNWAGSTNYIGAIIKKNNIEVSQTINGSPSAYLSVFIPCSIIEVEQNDIIEVDLYSPSGGTLRSGSQNTWLCVEKID